MIKQFNKIAIIAPGLLGGSIGYACREVGYEVAFWGRNAAKLEAVKAAGFEASTDLSEVIAGAELVILATPVPYMAEMAQQLIEAGLTPAQLVTDVGSVKVAVLNAVQPHLGSQGYSFIGSHPMAGSEQQGFEFSDPRILLEATCIVTPDSFSNTEHISALVSFWESLKMKAPQLTAEEHDKVVSRVSHVPHILSSVCAHIALGDVRNGQFSGGGLKDTSRVASGDADLWAGILSENSTKVTAHLQEVKERIERYQIALQSEDLEVLTALLREDKGRRDAYFL